MSVGFVFEVGTTVETKQFSGLFSGVARGGGGGGGEGGGCPRRHFLWRMALSVGAALWVSNTSCIIRILILIPECFRKLSEVLKSAVRMQEMPFQRPKFQNISGGHAPRHPPRLTPLTAGTYMVFWDILRTRH